MPELKLFVWRNVQCDYTCGIMFALAESKAEAIKVIEAGKKDWELIDELYLQEPEIFTSPKGFIIHGGG